jgi:hypothetical protein
MAGVLGHRWVAMVPVQLWNAIPHDWCVLPDAVKAEVCECTAGDVGSFPAVHDAGKSTRAVNVVDGHGFAGRLRGIPKQRVRESECVRWIQRVERTAEPPAMILG